MKMMDLVKAIDQNAQIKIIGVRPGEKLHEILLTSDEARHSLEFDDHFVIEPEFAFWQKDNFKHRNFLPEGFSYSSDNNTQWFSSEDFKKMMQTF